MIGWRIFAAVAAMPVVFAAVPNVRAAETEHPEAELFDAERGALADVGLALARALISRNNVLLVMGANWCHDSRGLAGWFETSRFQAMIEQRYELVYVDVGHPQDGEGRNIDIAQQFGIEEITGTPTVLILSPEGALLNADTATGWNNAASRTEDEIFDYFDGFQ
jgi:thioredoxin-like negative regulator of GroEL